MLAVLIAFFALTEATAVREHPATKIISLLQKLEQQVKAEGEQESADFARFQTWCSELSTDKQNIISKSKDAISKASSEIEALTADIDALGSELDDLAKQLNDLSATKAALGSQRDSDNTDYNKNRADLEGTIDAVHSAIASLKDQKPGLVQTQEVQKVLALLDTFEPASGKKVHAFLQARQDPDAANADKFEDRTGRTRNYDFKSGGVIEMLKKLALNFEDQLAETNRDETASKSGHALADAAKQDEIDAATKAQSTKTELKGRKGQDRESSTQDLNDAQTAFDGASTVLSKTKSTCRMRSDEFGERVRRRDGEREAMKQAVEVLEKVTGVRDPADKAMMFLQISDPRMQIVNLLRKAGSAKRTESLAKLADKIAALKQTPGSGVFDSIKNMIQKMIFHLKSEQTSENNHKAWCDKEHQQTNQTIDDKETRKKEFDASIEDLRTGIEELQLAVNDNNKQVVDMNQESEQITDMRNEDHEENAATIKDAQDAQTAIDQAIAILKDFYKSTGEVAKEAWEFAQTSAEVRRTTEDPAEPKVFESAQYKGTDGGSRVIQLLTDTGADFAGMESQAQADETTQQDNYDADLTALKIDISTTEKDTEMKNSRVGRLSEKLEGKEADNAHNQKELEAHQQYAKDLFRACDDGDSSYDDRKQARTDEIDALKKAQGILEDAFKETEGETDGGSPPP